MAIDDVLAVATFGVIAAFAGAYYSGEEITLIDPFVEILISVGLGTLAGFVSFFIVRRIQSEAGMIIATVILILATMALGIVVGAELMITGITFGLVLFNALDEAPRVLFESANRKQISASIIFFLVLIGGTLDISAILSLAALVAALVYVIVRGGGKLLGSFLGTTLARSESTVRQYLGFTLLAAAGVSLTFVGIAGAFLPDEMSRRLGIMIGGAALINEVVAVFATRWGFGQAGEMYQRTDGQTHKQRYPRSMP